MRAPDCARLQDVQPTRTSEQVCRRFDADASCCTMHRSGRRRCVYQHGNGTCMLSPEHDQAGYCSYQPCQCPSCIEHGSWCRARAAPGILPSNQSCAARTPLFARSSRAVTDARKAVDPSTYVDWRPPASVRDACEASAQGSRALDMWL